METAKERFLIATSVANEENALRNCVLASFRRNKIYSKNAAGAQRWELRQSLKHKLAMLGAKYIDGSVSEREHETNILTLADALSEEYGEILVNGRFNIGTSQKALNLYLKFLWCLGRLPTPPHHCPVDRVVLSGLSVNGAWTRLDDIATYRAWIAMIRETAGEQPLSEWELEMWNGTL